MTRKSNYAEKETVAWFLNNICEEESGKVFLKEIIEKISLSPEATGNFMKKLFPQVQCKRVRPKANWEKKEKVYLGVAWRNIENVAEITSNLGDISKYFTKHCFIINETESEIEVGYPIDYILNGNRLIAEVKFYKNCSWSVSVCGKKINITNLGLSNKFTICQSSVDNVFEAIKKFKYCKGIQHPDEAVTVHHDCLKEIWNKCGDENSQQSVLRCKSCVVVLTYTSCVNCRQLQKKEIKDNPSQPEQNEVVDEPHVILSDTDHNDFCKILHKVIPECPENLKHFLNLQKEAIQRKPKGRRWSKEVIRLCLTLWCRSPRGYSELRSSGFIVLPSARILQYYKNAIDQTSGFNKEMFHWMLNEARNKNISPEGYEGGLLIDEMSLEQDIQFSKKGGNFKMVGFKDVTEESIAMDILMQHKKNVCLSKYALQFLFLGNTGFRFPFTYFASTGASASELYLVFWKAVNYLAMFGFTVTFLSMDGAQSNRDFMNILLHHRETGSFTFNNVFNPSRPKITAIMDFSHVMKKIRNNISKSGKTSQNKKTLTLGGEDILWEHWRNAYLWDISTNPFPIHRKLNQDHFFLTSESKMRNHLAEDVLDKEMLHLMKKYRETLGIHEKHKLDSSILLLENTSVLIKNFRDSRPLTDASDSKLVENDKVLLWFTSWEREIKDDKTKKNQEKCLISHQTRQDIASLITGFKEFCQNTFLRLNTSINPSRVNSDVIENIFCQQRALYNGANSNPTFLAYSRTINSIVLGQATISNKSNSGGSSAEPFQVMPPTKKKLKK